ALLIRGALMLADPSLITSLAGVQQVYLWYSYIIGAHLIGGLFLALGIFTRAAALVQIPVVAGAIVFIHLGEGLMTVGQSLELASLVLFLLVVFSVFGTGPVTIGKLLGRSATA
ncbi:MAG: DoxX family membrane protein, partial [Bacteroidetes bacterium]|nr:DoxX family membrane protein [Bacteroidota bacterium]